MNSMEYCQFIRQFDFVVASRYHAMVHAYRECVPVVCLGWAVKYHELAQMLGQQDYAIDIDKCTETNIRSILLRMNDNYLREKGIISSKMKELQHDNCFEECWKIL